MNCDLISIKNSTVIKPGRCMFQYIMTVLSYIMLLKVIVQLNTKTIIFRTYVRMNFFLSFFLSFRLSVFLM